MTLPTMWESRLLIHAVDRQQKMDAADLTQPGEVNSHLSSPSDAQGPVPLQLQALHLRLPTSSGDSQREGEGKGEWRSFTWSSIFSTLFFTLLSPVQIFALLLCFTTLVSSSMRWLSVVYILHEKIYVLDFEVCSLRVRTPAVKS